MADPIGTIKNISEIIKKYNDLELMKQVVELQSEMFELERENLALKKQVEQFEERGKLKMVGPMNYYFKEGDEVPFCPKCLESDGKAVHLPSVRKYYWGQGRTCLVCKTTYHEQENPPQQRPRQVGGTWS